MPTVDQFCSFLLVSAICIAAPGPDSLGVLSIGISRGRRAGMGFAIGCALGCLTHTLWAVVGISALIAASRTAFLILQYAGAAYLFYLGVKALRSGGSLEAIDHDSPVVSSRGTRLKPFVLRGFISNALNPKVGLFFLAFLPQFVDKSQPVALQTGMLGCVFSIMTMAAFAVLGYYSGAAGQWLKRREGVGKWLDRVTGCVFIGLAGHLVLPGKRS